MNAPLLERPRLRRRRRSIPAIFAAPAAVGVASAAGLTVGLIGAGGWDVLACLCLSPPILLSAWHGRGR